VGSGFFVTDDLLLTNAHVLCPTGTPMKVHFRDGRELPGEPVDSDDEIDLALVKVPGAMAKPLELGDGADLNAGDRAVFIGTPLGMEYTVHEGIVSHAGRNFFGVAYIQIDANVNPGNSGGPLLDRRGKVVGVISMMMEGGSGLGFALPINYAHGEVNLIEAPELATDRWSELKTRVDDANQSEIKKAAEAFELPAVGMVAVEGRSLLITLIMRRAAFQPGSEDISFTISRDGTPICSQRMTVFNWYPFSDIPEADSDIPNFRWLRKHGLTTNLYFGAVHYSAPICAEAGSLVGAEFVLEGGDPNFNRTTILPAGAVTPPR
jgi:serine protease Do